MGLGWGYASCSGGDLEELFALELGAGVDDDDAERRALLVRRQQPSLHSRGAPIHKQHVAT
jgi:hypothetical protein